MVKVIIVSQILFDEKRKKASFVPLFLFYCTTFYLNVNRSILIASCTKKIGKIDHIKQCDTVKMEMEFEVFAEFVTSGFEQHNDTGC